MPQAAIDVGSNSILLTIVSDAGEVLHDEARVVGLGKGLGDRGTFAPDRMEAAEDVLGRYVEVAERRGIPAWQIRAVATSAARRAMNAETWLARVHRKLGLRIQVIPGTEEARLTWLGATRELDAPGPLLVVDLGGGSTELVHGDGGQDTARASLEVGTVRATEAFLGVEVVAPAAVEKLKNHVDSLLSSVDVPERPGTVVGVAGTATTLAALDLGLRDYDGEAVHGHALTRTGLQAFVRDWLPLSPEQRLARCEIAPKRADVLLAGAVVLERVLAAARAERLVVSDHGLRFGLLVR